MVLGYRGPPWRRRRGDPMARLLSPWSTITCSHSATLSTSRCPRTEALSLDLIYIVQAQSMLLSYLPAPGTSPFLR